MFLNSYSLKSLIFFYTIVYILLERSKGVFILACLGWHELNSRYCLAFVVLQNMSVSILEFIFLN